MARWERAEGGARRGLVGVLLLLHTIFLIVPALAAAASEETRVVIPAGDSPSLGPKDAPVTIIKFTDYQ